MRENKGTYDVLIFLCIVSYLWNCDGPTNVLFVLGRAYDLLTHGPVTWNNIITFVLHL